MFCCRALRGRNLAEAVGRMPSDTQSHRQLALTSGVPRRGKGHPYRKPHVQHSVHGTGSSGMCWPEGAGLLRGPGMSARRRCAAGIWSCPRVNHESLSITSHRQHERAAGAFYCAETFQSPSQAPVDLHRDIHGRPPSRTSCRPQSPWVSQVSWQLVRCQYARVPIHGHAAHALEMDASSPLKKTCMSEWVSSF